MNSSSFSPRPLDSSQRAFCELPGDAIRLLAPAGSGKTHALLWRCRKLVHDNPNTQILMFTFTRAARDELCERLKRPDFAHIQANVTITTLNSYGYQIVKSAFPRTTLVTDKRAIQNCMQVLMPVWQKYPMVSRLLEAKHAYKSWETLFELSDTLKSLGFRHDRLNTFEDFRMRIALLSKIGMGQMLKKIFSDLFTLKISDHYSLEDLQQLWLMREVEDAYKAHVDTVLREIYQNHIIYWCESTEYLIKCGLITLEDQKYIARLHIQTKVDKKLFNTNNARIPHIFVDEFQDINPLDLSLLKAISSLNQTYLTIVGDDDQAIYEWRGASPAFILAPEKFLGTKYVTRLLSVNYRSPQNIVALAQNLIEHNHHRFAKRVEAANRSMANIEILSHQNLTDAIDDTIHRVQQILPTGQRIVLISRKRSQLIPYQIVFADLGIPFCAAEDLQIFLSQAFQELRECILICDQIHCTKGISTDPRSLILTLCDKIKRFPLSKPDRAALSQYLLGRAPQTLWEALACLREYHGPLKGDNSDAKQSKYFADILKELFEATTVSESISVFGKCFEGLQKDYGKSEDDIFYTDPPFVYLSAFAQKYGSDYQKFSNDIDKAMQTLSNYNEQSADADASIFNRQLHLMTALRTKGREFDTVFILDTVNNIWPSKLAKTEDELEQERRLFYVAMTRAKKNLFFVVENNLGDTQCNVSPYLQEMGLI
ncbi:MAG: ATP-dependent helicase [Proteobacteria bacterium]|nr:ATP-dependent helicase [Pseudomonadota bacterium]